MHFACFASFNALICITSFVWKVSGACEFFATEKDKIPNEVDLDRMLILNLQNCKKPDVIKRWLDAESVHDKFPKLMPSLYLQCVCNSYPDTYLYIHDDKNYRHYLMDSLTLKSLGAEQQRKVTWILRTCPCDNAKENLLHEFCPALTRMFDNVDPGFFITCFRSMFTNKYEMIEILLEKKEPIKEQFYVQIFHEALYQLAFFKLFNGSDFKTLISHFPSGLPAALREEKFSQSIYQILIKNTDISPEIAYLCDRLKFYLVYASEILNPPVAESVYEEIAQFPESNVLLKAFDKEVTIKHFTLDQIRKIAYIFIRNAHRYPVEDSSQFLVALYEFWNKSFSDKAKRNDFEIDFSCLKEILAEFIASKPGRPNYMLNDIFKEHYLTIPGISKQYLVFRNFLHNFFYQTDFSNPSVEQDSKKKEDWFPNCFLVKHDVIDLTLDWLDDKMLANKYSFDKPFANEIFRFLVKIPSVTFYILTNKRKFIRYLAPLIIDKKLFSFHEEDTPLWGQDFHLFCQLFSDSQLQFTRNDILTYYFDAFDNAAVKMERAVNNDFLTGKTGAVSGQNEKLHGKKKQSFVGYQPIYEYLNIKEENFVILSEFLYFLNTIKNDMIFSTVFDTIFVRKERYQLDKGKLSSNIHEELPILLQEFGFDSNESNIPIMTNIRNTLSAMKDKSSFHNKIVIFLQHHCTKKRNIIGGIDMDRLEIILLRIPKSDLRKSTAGMKLVKDCEEFSDRLWSLYKSRKLLNMAFLGAQGLIRKWSMDRIEAEQNNNADKNSRYFEERKKAFGI